MIECYFLKWQGNETFFYPNTLFYQNPVRISKNTSYLRFQYFLVVILLNRYVMGGGLAIVCMPNQSSCMGSSKYLVKGGIWYITPLVPASIGSHEGQIQGGRRGGIAGTVSQDFCPPPPILPILAPDWRAKVRVEYLG